MIEEVIGRRGLGVILLCFAVVSTYRAARFGKVGVALLDRGDYAKSKVHFYLGCAWTAFYAVAGIVLAFDIPLRF